MSPTKKEVIELVTKAMHRNEAYCKAAESRIGIPEVWEMCIRAEARRDAYRAVLDALERGETYLLRVDAAGHIGVKGDD